MLPLYIVAAILGGGLILISAFFGGHDHDVDHNADVDHSHDSDSHHDAALWLPFLSIRFWTYALAMFGAVGWASEVMTNTAKPTILMGSIISGLVLGLVVSLIMRWIQKAGSDSSVRTEDLLGVAGRVTVPVHAQSDGKVRLTVRGDSIDFLALSNDDRSITQGEEVVVVAVENDRLRVIPKTDIYQELP